MRRPTIYISQIDLQRLGNLIELVRNEGDRSDLSYVGRLENELETAEIVEPEHVPPDVITMRSTVEVRDMDTLEQSVYSIVFPSEANADQGKLSVLAPLATALLGSRRGSTVEVQAPGRLRKLKVIDILYQPEAAGDYDL